jgi:hypothetical protein
VVQHLVSSTKEEFLLSEKIANDARTLLVDSSRVYYAANLLRKISSLGILHADVPDPGTCPESDATCYRRLVTGEMRAVKKAALMAEADANLVKGIILSFVSPILFGTIGAVASVIRNIRNKLEIRRFYPVRRSDI